MNSRDLLIFAGGMAAIAALTAALHFLPAVSPMTVALALLLVVLGAATLSRLPVAIVVSIVACWSEFLLSSPGQGLRSPIRRTGSRSSHF